MYYNEFKRSINILFIFFYSVLLLWVWMYVCLCDSRKKYHPHTQNSITIIWNHFTRELGSTHHSWMNSIKNIACVAFNGQKGSTREKQGNREKKEKVEQKCSHGAYTIHCGSKMLPACLPVFVAWTCGVCVFPWSACIHISTETKIFFYCLPPL